MKLFDLRWIEREREVPAPLGATIGWHVGKPVETRVISERVLQYRARYINLCAGLMLGLYKMPLHGDDEAWTQWQDVPFDNAALAQQGEKNGASS